MHIYMYIYTYIYAYTYAYSVYIYVNQFYTPLLYIIGIPDPSGILEDGQIFINIQKPDEISTVLVSKEGTWINE
jgi:hypothetical protein